MFHVEHFVSLCVLRIKRLNLQILMPPRRHPAIPLQSGSVHNALQRFTRDPACSLEAGDKKKGQHQSRTKPWEVHRPEEEFGQVRQLGCERKVSPRLSRRVWQIQEKRKNSRPKGAHVRAPIAFTCRGSMAEASLVMNNPIVQMQTRCSTWNILTKTPSAPKLFHVEQFCGTAQAPSVPRGTFGRSAQDCSTWNNLPKKQAATI